MTAALADPVAPMLAMPVRAMGVITPSANLVVERVTAAVLQSFPDISAHYSRSPVRGSRDPFPASYNLDGMLGAARLLGDASVEAIVWNGSKGASIGFAHDRDLAAAITRETGIAATTSVLAIDADLKWRGITRVGVVTPYRRDEQERLCAVLEAEGYRVVAEAHSGVADNLAYMRVPPAEIAAMVGQVAAARPEAVLTLCTNFPAAFQVAALEAAIGLPVYDTTLAGVWAGLVAAGIDTRPGAPVWGRMFVGGRPS
ncbi:aspartate/glutamate racemase family protein [Prosthecomicrobium hirschii]|uniref:maleate cis-trans isomerase family protein n=1 Tax=Prosthecodimorpha hirschii TaxID=665126 RepID=UPI00221ECBEB|nr:aspartate/glutamate racemase family protein [Prosthecomicrobium hirschii]MCW1840048.1 aspartate/glutamate racemase family protein [Prosthecomicrobium hirschii]